jgi:hypothetical protein
MPKENLEIMESPSAASLQKKAYTNAADSLENAEQVYFTQPGNFQLRK